MEEICFTRAIERCKRCYEPQEDHREHSFCKACFKAPSPFYRLLCPFELTGPALSLHRPLRRYSTSFISKGLSGFMGYYYLKANLAWPDMIVPIPDALTTRVFHGESASYGLAKMLSQILNVHLHSKILAKKSESYYFRAENSIENKKILLVGEMLDADFFKAGESLIEGLPHSIIGLGLSVGMTKR